MIRMALAATSRTRGGPAHSAIIASSVFGMSSGSAESPSVPRFSAQLACNPCPRSRSGEPAQGACLTPCSEASLTLHRRKKGHCEPTVPRVVPETDVPRRLPTGRTSAGQELARLRSGSEYRQGRVLRRAPGTGDVGGSTCQYCRYVLTHADTIYIHTSATAGSGEGQDNNRPLLSICSICSSCVRIPIAASYCI